MRNISLVSGGILTVLEIPGTESWGFWDFYAGGQWETTTLAEADRLLGSGDLLFDIGAWVGPLTLWEARRGVNVVAVEPDPEAFEALKQNVSANGLDGLVKLEQVAITDQAGEIQLGLQDISGDSQSSVTRQDMPKTVPVVSNTLGWLLNKYGRPTVVKMDIEGGESLVLPTYGPILRTMNVPLLLALHPNWYAPGTENFIVEELIHWRIKDLYNNMYLCTPA